MARLSALGIEQYSHSPAHHAIAHHDIAGLGRILAALPTLPQAGQVVNEEESMIAEEQADRVSAVIDRRDVPGKETPLHLAVRLGDAVAVEMLMAAGADWSLQNEQGWSALQEAVCAREEGIAKVITKYYQPMAWAKWCRRLPRIIGAMRRMRDFYTELTFNFESTVIPFIGRIAPSDTYKIWKRGSNLRADMSLAGFDGFKIQRSDQSFLFFGDGTEDGKVPPGSLLVLTHKDKEVANALEGAGVPLSEAEIAQEVSILSKTNMYRPGIDVTQAELVSQLTWRRQDRTEIVGSWKAKVFDMHHVLLSVRSRRVPGAMTDEELLAAETEAQGVEEDDYTGLLTEEEKQQLETVLSTESFGLCDDGCSRHGTQMEDHGDKLGSTSLSGPDRKSVEEPVSSVKETRKVWFSWEKRAAKQESRKENVPVVRLQDTMLNRQPDKLDASTSIKNETSGKILTQNGKRPSEAEKRSHGIFTDGNETHNIIRNGSLSVKTEKEKAASKLNGTKELPSKRRPTPTSNDNFESEYKKGLRPVLWLTQEFPLKVEELLPLLDILSSKVKAIRRLRELLTTKLPTGTFPVKMAIPIIPSIRVVVTFNKFEELPATEEFCTPISSPEHFQDSKWKDPEIPLSVRPWFSWIRGSRDQVPVADFAEECDPFRIPSDYTWVDKKEKKRRLKAKRAKGKKGKKPPLKPPETAAYGEGEK